MASSSTKVKIGCTEFCICEEHCQNVWDMMSENENESEIAMMIMKMKIWTDLREWNFIFFQYIKSNLSSILLLILSAIKIFINCNKMAKKLY